METKEKTEKSLRNRLNKLSKRSKVEVISTSPKAGNRRMWRDSIIKKRSAGNLNKKIHARKKRN